MPIRWTMILLALVAGCAQVAEGAPPPADLDVMTFNLRVADAKWESRRPVMRALLTAASPDLIGTQEGHPGQLDDIESDLGAAYDRVGTGRDGDGRGQQTAIFYDTTRLAPISSGHYWLSETPETEGSRSWGSGYPRVVTWMRFADLANGRQFYAVNAHLDNRSADARLRGARLIARRLAAFAPLPMVLTGDFNSPAESSDGAYRTLTGNAGLRDTWTGPPAYGTFHDYRPLVPGGPRIDWILTTPDVTTLTALVDTYHEGAQYPSDHLPVRARLRFR